MKKLKFLKKVSALATVFLLVFTSISATFAATSLTHRNWSGDINDPYIEVNGNKPEFTSDELAKAQKGYFLDLTKLDKLGRCGVAMMCVDIDKMPTSDREDIGSVTPSGWKYNKKSNNNKYPGLVPNNYIFNRCHLLGFQMSALNDEKRNLITGTRFLNVIGMLPFENDVTGYVKSTGKHVLYRVTPIFIGNNLIAEGVQMEAFSIEDNGKGICFNVFCPNVQKGVEINYLTGENWLESEEVILEPQQTQTTQDTSNSGGVGAAAAGGGTGAVILFIIVLWFIFKGDKPRDPGQGQPFNNGGYTPMQGWNGGGNTGNLFG